jgi:hypothetical protein
MAAFVGSVCVIPRYWLECGEAVADRAIHGYATIGLRPSWLRSEWAGWDPPALIVAFDGAWLLAAGLFTGALIATRGASRIAQSLVLAMWFVAVPGSVVMMSAWNRESIAPGAAAWLDQTVVVLPFLATIAVIATIALFVSVATLRRRFRRPRRFAQAMPAPAAVGSRTPASPMIHGIVIAISILPILVCFSHPDLPVATFRDTPEQIAVRSSVPLCYGALRDGGDPSLVLSRLKDVMRTAPRIPSRDRTCTWEISWRDPDEPRSYWGFQSHATDRIKIGDDWVEFSESQPKDGWPGTRNHIIRVSRSDVEALGSLIDGQWDFPTPYGYEYD